MSTPPEAPDTSAAPPISIPRPTTAAAASSTSASSSVPVPGAHPRQTRNLNISLYPQLFDIIIAFSPYENLIALRGVCRTFRENNNNIQIPTYPVHLYQRQYGHHAGDLLSFELWILLSYARAVGHHLQSLAAITKTLQSTRVVEFVGPVMDMTVLQLFMAIEHRVTVRLRPDAMGDCQLALGESMLSEMDTLKLYLMVMSRTSRLIIFTSIWDLLNPAVPYPDFGHPMLDKLVLDKMTLNVSFDPDSVVAPPDINDTEYPTGLQNLTVVFRAEEERRAPVASSHSPSSSLSVREGAAEEDDDDLGASTLKDIKAHMDVVIAGFGFFLDEVHHTLVNVCDLNPTWIGADPSASPTTWEGVIRDKIKQDVHDRRPDLDADELEALLESNLRFLSLEEYEQELGAYEFRIETAEVV